MSVDYSIKLRRKSDDKVLAEFYANILKNILDSEYSDMIHCEGRNADNAKFDVNDLNALSDKVFDKIISLKDEIYHKDQMIPKSKNVEVMHEIEDQIACLKEEIIELKWVLYSADALHGIISCLTEDLIKQGRSAYVYNGKDLPKKKAKDYNGNEYDAAQYIWVNDVYCEIKASW